MNSPKMNNRRQRQRGFVLMTMAAAAIALIGVLGLAIDVGRLFIVKNETQAYVDAASLAAALKLDGTSAGITNATNAATTLADSWNFGTTTVASPTVEFATTSAGAWSTNPGSGAGILYVRVTSKVQPYLYFIPVVMATKIYQQDVYSRAVAGQIDITSFPEGLSPFAGVASNTTGPNFGYTVGGEYDIQWPQYNSTRNGCSVGQPDRCFNAPPCANETKAAEQAIVQDWGSNINGYWGYSSNSDIAASILDRLQLAAVPVGYDFQLAGNCGLTQGCLSNGNKAAIANYLDERVNQDPVNYGNSFSTYTATAGHNGRRMIVMPIVNPNNATGSSQSPVVGYGQFMLESNFSNAGHTSDYYQKQTGNQPFCAIYAGSFDLGNINNGSGGSTGASRVRLVQ